MTFLWFYVFIVSLAGVAISVPTPANLALARRYAPQFRFHKDEGFWPSSVEYFLGGANLRVANGNDEVPGQPSPLTDENVDDIVNQGQDTFLYAAVNTAEGTFLRGQRPSETQPATYTFIAPKANGVVDIFYWLFFPFNEGKDVPVLGRIGDHVGDWERLTVRTVNGIATQVDYHAHGDTGSGTIPWSEVVKFDNDRPVGYVAKGSHGLWAKAGTFTYVNAVIFKLQDLTSDGGVSWDTKDAIFGINYPETYEGSLDWLDYRGKWGNKGQTDCWWHSIYDECKLVDGPGGPLRDDVLGAAKEIAESTRSSTLKNSMSGSLSQTLATVSSGSSSFTFRVNVVSLKASHAFLIVEQRCHFAAANATKATTTIASAYTALSRAVEYTVDVSSCGKGATVSAYTIGVCASSTPGDDDCLYAKEGDRALRAFSSEPGVLGIQETAAVTVDDLDDWSW